MCVRRHSVFHSVRSRMSLVVTLGACSRCVCVCVACSIASVPFLLLCAWLHQPGKARTYIPPAEEDMVRDIDALKLCGGLQRYYVTRTPLVGILKGALQTEGGDRQDSRQRVVIVGLRHLNLPRPPFLVEVTPSLFRPCCSCVAMLLLDECAVLGCSCVVSLCSFQNRSVHVIPVCVYV